MTEKLGFKHAYKEFRDNSKLRETLRIDPEVWNMLRSELKIEIRRIRDQKKLSTSIKQSKYNNYGDTRIGAMVLKIEEQVEVLGNMEYENQPNYSFCSPRSSYALCDSGADTCVVGRLARIESISIRTINLVGYDPQTTRSPNLPIVTALIKTLSAQNVPVLLRICEAVFNKNSYSTLLSEYQLRDHGIIVDSVATKHLTMNGKGGTQTLYASSLVKCPLIDRGGLMGLKLYPIDEGDEDRYEIITITSSNPWKPRRCQDAARTILDEEKARNNLLKVIKKAFIHQTLKPISVQKKFHAVKLKCTPEYYLNGNVIKLEEAWRKMEDIIFYRSRAYLEFRKRVKFKVGVMRRFS